MEKNFLITTVLTVSQSNSFWQFPSQQASVSLSYTAATDNGFVIEVFSL